MSKIKIYFEKRRKEKQSHENYVPFKRKVQNIMFMWKLIFSITPAYGIFGLIYFIFDGIAGPIYSVFFLKWIVDLLSQGAPFSSIIHVATFVGIVFLIDITVSRIMWNVVDPRESIKLTYAIHKQQFKKATKLELEKYDDSEFYNKFIYSLSNSDTLVFDTLRISGRVISFVTTMLVTGGFIIATDFYMIGFVILSVLLSTLIVFIRNKVSYKYDLELGKFMAKRDYVQRVFSIPDFAKEMKITRVNELLLRKYDKVIDSMADCVDKYGPKMAALSSASSISTNFIFRMGTLVYLSIKTLVFHTISYGNFVGIYNAIKEFQGTITRLMQDVPQFDLSSMKIENFHKFYEYQPKMQNTENAIPVEKELAPLKIKNLTYTYTSGKDPVLKNINLTIHPGEKVAIVGYNGAGKSTLIKLILRLYDPDSGEVIYGGHNVKDYNAREYRGLFGVTFQDFQIYACDVKSNVLMAPVEEKDIANIENSLKKSGVLDKIKSLDHGLDTELTREYYDKGVNLSGGESQKLAISRVFAHSNEFVILDEPSAALDPIAEYEFNKTTLEACNNKSVIFISHRLSTTIEADRIIMLEKGQIVEQGSHEELMKLNGKYAEMFNKQAESYIEGVKAAQEEAC